MPDNHKLVHEWVESKVQYGYAYATGCLEVLVADLLFELEVRNPKAYEGKVEFIKKTMYQRSEERKENDQ